MAHQILIHGKRLDPKDAAKILLPLDTRLICPACNGEHVGANESQTTTQFSGELKTHVPRQQDRWCFDCGHRWVTVLHPEGLQPTTISLAGSRR